MSNYKRKYQKGEPITSIDELMSQDFVYFYDKITNRGWFGSWQLRWAKMMIDRGKFVQSNSHTPKSVNLGKVEKCKGGILSRV